MPRSPGERCRARRVNGEAPRLKKGTVSKKKKTSLADATRTAPKVVLTCDEVRTQLVEWIKVIDGGLASHKNVRDVGDLAREMEDKVCQWVEALDEEEI